MTLKNGFEVGTSIAETVVDRPLLEKTTTTTTKKKSSYRQVFAQFRTHGFIAATGATRGALHTYSQ